MNTRTKKMLAGGTLVLAGFGAGAAVAVTGTASAAGTGAPTYGATQPAPNQDPSQSIRPDEHLLSGTTATKVRAAALAKYPGATIQRVETDSDGVYEAHIVTKAGTPLIVQVGKDFTVAGTQDFGGHGDFDGDGPHGAPPSGSGPAA